MLLKVVQGTVGPALSISTVVADDFCFQLRPNFLEMTRKLPSHDDLSAIVTLVKDFGNDRRLPYHLFPA